MRLTTLALCSISSALILSAALAARSDTSTRDGVYTAAQADEGHTVYTQKCTTCHGPALAGNGQNPPLAGDQFLQNWTGQTLADLYNKIQATMPVTQPGSLKPKEIPELLAYILRENNYPAGKAELPQTVDQLQHIHMEMPLDAGQ